MKTPNPKGFPRSSCGAGTPPPTSAQLREDAKHWSFDEKLRTRAKTPTVQKAAASLFAELSALLDEEASA